MDYPRDLDRNLDHLAQHVRLSSECAYWSPVRNRLRAMHALAREAIQPHRGDLWDWLAILSVEELCEVLTFEQILRAVHYLLVVMSPADAKLSDFSEDERAMLADIAAQVDLLKRRDTQQDAPTT